jgi:hypothetical protein
VLLLLRNPVEDGTQNRPLLHGDYGIARDGSAKPQQSFAINQIKQFDQGQVVHLATALGDEPTRGLNRLSLVEFEFDGFHYR